MQVAGFGLSAAAWLNSIGKSADAPTRLDVSLPKYDGRIEQADVAAPRMSLPTVPPANLNAEALLALQDAGAEPAQNAPARLNAEPGTSESLDSSAADQFLDYMKKTPEERLRDKILKALGLSEEDVASMSPDERIALEKKIRDIIKETIVKAEGEAAPEREQAGVRATQQQFMLDIV